VHRHCLSACDRLLLVKPLAASYLKEGVMGWDARPSYLSNHAVYLAGVSSFHLGVWTNSAS
jgi:hypothetical protein